MRTHRWGLFVYPWDFNPETIDGQVEALAQLGISRLVCAVLYHDGRQFSPTGPTHIRWVDGGVSYVPARDDRYPPGLTPQTSRDHELVAKLLDRAATYDLTVEAWTVALHRDDLLRRPYDGGGLVENVFGEVHPIQLCPSSTPARRYLHAHLADVARAGFTETTLEGCHFPPLAHGYHHESVIHALPQSLTWLLEICFCNSCAQRFARHVDLPRVRSIVRQTLERGLAGRRPTQPLPPTMDELVRLRADAVTELVSEIAAGSRIPVRFVDQATIAGAVFRTGRLGKQPPAQSGWRYGLDYQALSTATDAVVALGYLTRPAELRRHLSEYERQGVSPDRLDVVLRPMPPDSRTLQAFKEKLALVRQLNPRRIDFYNLGFARPLDLKRLKVALEPA